MRPITLTMAAFGPYASKTVIDFNKLGNNGIYLITGDTGAGKTTVFDGISYGLFGNPSGDIRDDSMLRSKYAEDNQETYVELVFENRGKEYRIKRNPEYMRPSKRDANKMVSQKQDAELHLPDGKVITQKNRVNEKIEEILGLNRNQFSQIAMIAQGDFRKLLLADTKQRQQIFRKIFKTNIYQAFQMEVNDKLKEVNVARAKIKTGMDQYIQGIKSNHNELYNQELLKAKNDQMPLSEILELLEKLIGDDKRCVDENLQLKKENDEKLKSLDNKLSEIKRREIKEEDLTKVLENLEKNNQEKINLEGQLVEKASNKEKAQEINNTIILLEKELDSYEELDNLIVELKKAETNLTQLSEGEIQLTESNKTEEKKLEELKEELSLLGKAGENLINLSHEKERLKTLRTQLKEYKEQLKDLNKLEEDYKKAQDSFLKAQSNYEILREDAYEKRRLFNSEQAGILAQTLQENEPCPVCGSLNHPNKAILKEGAPSKKQVEKAEEDSKEALEKANEKSHKAGQIKGQVDGKTTELNKNKEKLVEIHGGDAETFNDHVKELIISLNEKITTFEDDIEKEKTKVNRKETLEEVIPKREETLKKKEKEVLEIHESVIKATNEKGNLNNKIEELKGKLNFQSGKQLKEHVEKLRKDSQLLLEEVETLEKAIEQVKNNNSKLTGQKIAIEEDLKNIEIIDKEGLDKEATQLKEIKSNLETVGKEVYARYENNKSIKENIESKANEQLAVDEKWQWVKAIADTANGKISGKERIMLETYVQMTYFDRILRRANIHFMKMSAGQYDLVRNKNADNYQSQTGLELDVIDHYNGSTRSVKSLSGGESFIASLSLALGLSEEIQNSASGIKLDTMFVDEGFGSLDEESLEQAMKALYSLAEEHRTIGIISHVAELRRKIDRQIVVSKEKTGSHIEIIT